MSESDDSQFRNDLSKEILNKIRTKLLLAVEKELNDNKKFHMKNQMLINGVSL